MKVLLINEVCGHSSTGRITCDIAEQLEKEGNIVRIGFGRDSFVPDKYKKYAVRIGTKVDVLFHAALTRLTDKHGLGSKRATRKFIEWANIFNPDLLWLHNLHGYFINYEYLFKWIKQRPNMEVRWTLHDCWAFTGHCTYFSMNNCNKWMTHCEKCVYHRSYPASTFFDGSYRNFEKKKGSFSNVKNMTIITPSKWLKDKVLLSFLKSYPVIINENTVDKNIFKYTSSDFRNKYGLSNKVVVLGVANVWEKRKGLEDFYYLAKNLGKEYAIVLVGLSDKQKKGLPDNIIGINHTKNQTELAKIYSAADYFVNPSREETFGMTTLEALSCGTKAIVYLNTACEEVALEHGGIVVPFGPENILNILKEKSEKIDLD